MKAYLFSLCVLASTCAIAQPAISPTVPQVALVFDRVPLVDLLKVVYGDVLKKNFVIHSDLSSEQRVLSLSILPPFDNKKVDSLIVDILETHGIRSQSKSGYTLISALPVSKPLEPLLSVYHYKAKYRSVQYLIDNTSSLFKASRFTTQRQIANVAPVSASPNIPTSSGALSPSLAPQRDSGTSAYSLLDKSDIDSFLFEGTPSDITKLRAILEQIDLPTGEVFVKASVYEFTTTSQDSTAFSLALSLISNRLGVNLKQAVNGSSFSFKSGDIDAVFSALSTDVRFKTLSNPSVRVKSGSTAKFSVGSDVPVLGSIQLDKNGTPLQSIDYRSSGSIFQVTPTVRDASIDLALSQQLSTFVATTTGVNNSPTLIKRDITTSISAQDGDVIVLGGLDDQKSTVDKNGLSFLPNFFHAKSSSSSNTQILLVLQVRKIPVVTGL